MSGSVDLMVAEAVMADPIPDGLLVLLPLFVERLGGRVDVDPTFLWPDVYQLWKEPLVKVQQDVPFVFPYLLGRHPSVEELPLPPEVVTVVVGALLLPSNVN